MLPGLLSGVRVLEIGGQISASYCGKILALLGAEVIKVESPEGDAARRAGPFPADLPHPEKSGLFLALNLNKFGVTLDLTRPEDRRRLGILARGATVVVGNPADSGIRREALRQENPALDRDFRFPFRKLGPLQALQGFRPGAVPHERPGARHAGDGGERRHATTDSRRRPPGGVRDRLVSCHGDVDGPVPPPADGERLSYRGLGIRGHGHAVDQCVGQLRLRSAAAGAGADADGRFRGLGPGRFYRRGAAVQRRIRCHFAREDAQWARWVELMGNPGWADEERFRTREGRELNFAELWERVGQWTRFHTKHHIARRGQEQRIPCFPVNTVRDLMDDPHLKYRGFFYEIEHPVAGRLAYPGVPYRFSRLTLPLTTRPAPLLGQHNKLVPGESDAAAPTPPAVPAAARTYPEQDRLPLYGVRVVDLSWIIAGPTAARFLAMMGAEVIKVGSARRPDPSTRGAPFQAYNQSKRSCSLNIAKPDGLDLAKKLIGISDVVIENFAAGVIERLGLGYEVLREVRPDVIMVSSSGTGHSGPDKDYVAYGSLLQYYTGWNSISGYPDGEPIKGGLWADPWVGLELAMVTAAALNHRAATGEGQYIDYSMAEGLTACLPEALLDFQMNARERPPMANADDAYTPHNLYRCQGPDRWVAIAVTRRGEWLALCEVIERPDLATDATLATEAGRRARQDEIDEAITSWTQKRDDYEAMDRLQQAGVPAGPFLEPSRLFHDPQLRQGGYFTRQRVHDGTWRDLPGLGWRFEDGPGPHLSPAPVLGQHNDYVFGNLLGLSEAEIARLTEEQVIY